MRIPNTCLKAVLFSISFLGLQLQAATLSGNLSVDNTLIADLSTSDNTIGGTSLVTFLAGNTSWSTAKSISPSPTLQPGVTYYIHVQGVDATGTGSGDAGFIGDFALTGAGHHFENPITNLDLGTTITTSNEWGVSTRIWTDPLYIPVAATIIGSNVTTAPWNNTLGASINPAAQWIWTANHATPSPTQANPDTPAYFTMKIAPNIIDMSITGVLNTTGPYFVGQTVTYTITVTNTNATDTAGNITITGVPANLTTTNISSTNCTTIPCSISSMAPNATEIITVTATINATGNFTYTADVTAANPDASLANNSISTTSISSATIRVIPTLSGWALALLSLLLLSYSFTSKKYNNK